MLLQILLIVCGVLLFFVIVTAVARFCKIGKEDYQKSASIDESVLKPADEPETAPLQEVKEEVKEEEVVEPIKEESKTVEVALEVSEEIAVTEDESEDVEPIVIGDVDGEAKDTSFASKLLSLDKSVQEYYDKINNEFGTFRRVHGRVSQKGVSYRLGRDLIAKLTIRGKTMRLNLALDTADFEQKIYFQKDMRDVKAYQEIPFMVKVKSDRGLTKALQLIEALAVKENMEKKARYFPVDSIENLKNLKK